MTVNIIFEAIQGVSVHNPFREIVPIIYDSICEKVPELSCINSWFKKLVTVVPGVIMLLTPPLYVGRLMKTLVCSRVNQQKGTYTQKRTLSSQRNGHFFFVFETKRHVFFQKRYFCFKNGRKAHF